jgi:lysophospholipase
MARRPAWFAAAALGSPLLGLNTGGIPGIVAQSLVTLAAGLGLGAHYAPGYGDAQLDGKRFETNKVTHSAERYAAHHQILVAHPELLMGGPSNQWVRSAFAATADVDGLARRVSTPLVLFQAGADAYVLLEPQDRFCRLAASCRLVRFPGAYHELIREQDDVRSALLDETLRHFAAHARQP